METEASLLRTPSQVRFLPRTPFRQVTFTIMTILTKFLSEGRAERELASALKHKANAEVAASPGQKREHMKSYHLSMGNHYTAQLKKVKHARELASGDEYKARHAEVADLEKKREHHDNEFLRLDRQK